VGSWDYQKDISGCGLSGLINKKGERMSGELIARSIATQHDRGNGLGGVLRLTGYTRSSRITMPSM